MGPELATFFQGPVMMLEGSRYDAGPQALAGVAGFPWALHSSPRARPMRQGICHTSCAHF